MAETPNPMVGSCPGLMTKITEFIDEFKLESNYAALVVGGDDKCLTSDIEIDCATREGGGISEIAQVDVIEIAPSGSTPLMKNTELWFSKTPLPTLVIDGAYSVTSGDEGEQFGPIAIATADYVQSPISTTAVATLKDLKLKFKTAGDTGSANSSKKIYMAHVATELTPYPPNTIIIILIKFKKH